ncbi:ATP-binding protein [Ideonella sp. DXS22W]|uniref:histidine kinase n=1 Tax=Pseudaquabacterium inlustre TaxID=2984192 RepID=A0ABU9CNT3_9BURK
MAGPRGTERRRQGDRRQGDRRRTPRSSVGDSWLSLWGDTRSGAAAGGRRDGDEDSGPPGARSAAARRLADEGAALPRILRTYVLARAALGAALVLAPWVAGLLGSRPPLLMMVVALCYASQAVSLWVLRGVQDGPPAQRLQPRQWLWTIGVDLLAFTALRLLDSAGQLNYGALLVLPVLMAGVLTRRVLALGTAAAVTLVLLGTAWWGDHPAGDLWLVLSQAGLSGAGLFLIALLSAELAQRLAREERSARTSLELARQQTQLNRVVIEEMSEGVLVIDRAGTLRAINPAARQLLGAAGQRLALPCPMSGEPALVGLCLALQQAYVQGSWPEASRELVLPQAEGEGRAVQVRARFTRRSGIAADDTPPEDICVLFIEDLRLLRGRQRQEKLAAMGRMSAGIAHEIRNPLAAIAQANALLLEDDLPPQQQRLTRIVADNVDRLKRIVDDVMAVAPGAAPSSAEIDARAEVALVVADWRRSAPGSWRADERLAVHLPDEVLTVRFDADHLRRVLVNLLDNAARHAGDQPGAMVLTLRPLTGGRAVLLSVASDGEPIPPEVERHLFEPFFSTRSRGGGLGLYICRELCERYGASIEFRLAAAHQRHRNVFSVVMRLAAAG